MTRPTTTSVNESDDSTGTVRNDTVWEGDEIEASGRFNQNDRLHFSLKAIPPAKILPAAPGRPPTLQHD